MTTSSKNTKKNFSPTNNKFLVSLDGVLRVQCIDCKGKCACIALPSFSMYFCENPTCRNNLELRYTDKGEFELHDYGACFKDEEVQASIEKLIKEQQVLIGPQPAKIYQFPKPVKTQKDR